MKCYILHDFRTSTPYKEKSSDHFKELDKLKLLTKGMFGLGKKTCVSQSFFCL